MSGPRPQADAGKPGTKRSGLMLALTLCVIGAGLLAWRLTARETPVQVDSATESRANALKEELRLKEQQRPPQTPEPEAQPDQHGRNARPPK